MAGLSLATASLLTWAPTVRALGLPMAHRLTFRSSPPVTSTPAVFLPICRQLTVLLCAVNSSARGREQH
jgi:hypothetical protein